MLRSLAGRTAAGARWGSRGHEGGRPWDAMGVGRHAIFFMAHPRVVSGKSGLITPCLSKFRKESLYDSYVDQPLWLVGLENVITEACQQPVHCTCSGSNVCAVLLQVLLPCAGRPCHREVCGTVSSDRTKETNMIVWWFPIVLSMFKLYLGFLEIRSYYKSVYY